jgi:hypothetical protein
LNGTALDIKPGSKVATVENFDKGETQEVRSECQALCITLSN